MILAIDPGRDKCGLAVMTIDKNVLAQAVLPRQGIAQQIKAYLSRYAIKTIVIGRTIFGKELEREINKLKLPAPPVFVSENNSTLEARTRYWQVNRPKGVWRLVPASLRTPPVPIDDWAAVILAERYLKG